RIAIVAVDNLVAAAVFLEVRRFHARSLLEGNFGALVLHPPRLVVPAWERAGLAHLHADPDPETELQIPGQGVAEPGPLAEGERRRGIEPHEDVVEAVATAEDDLELVHVAMGAHQLLDAPRVHDDAADLLHVVQPGEHAALEGDERA